MTDLTSQYKTREKEFQDIADNLATRYMRLSFIRLVVFIIGMSGVIFLFNYEVIIGVVCLFFFITLFIRFVLSHRKVKEKENHNRHLSIINGNEVSALNNNISSFNGGDEFIDSSHPYSYDLDVFGDHSFFQMCNRTVSQIGKKRLCEILTHVADKETIILRQEAIEELSHKIDWRQDFQAYGQDVDDNEAHLSFLEKWLDSPSELSSNKIILILRYLVPILSIIGLIVAFYEPWFIAVLFLIPAMWAIKKTLEYVNDTHTMTAYSENILSKYARLLAHIESEAFESPLLLTLKTQLSQSGKIPSKNIKRLSYIISQLNVRFNAFAIILNICGLWDIQWILKLEHWKSENKEDLMHWFNVLKELDALISLATLAANNPTWSFPKIVEDNTFSAINMGHPLIAYSEVVTNDLIMPTVGHMKLVTGSNMAGKSTFLRTIGLNMVLAYTGSKVCADKFEVPIMSVMTSMRTTDALHENTSSFYAELKRLKTILDYINNDNPVFFLLDEILKGTNSRDRHTGSKALIKQLIKSQSAGIIATHDLELSSLEEKYGGRLENLSMEVEVVEGELEFDYKLKKGVSKSFNATILMQRMGIEIEK